MVDKRTIRKILEKLGQGKTPETRIRGYRYTVEYNQEFDQLLLVPVGAGSVANSVMGIDRYEYTHGGNIYREAVDFAKALYEARTLKMKGIAEVN